MEGEGDVSGGEGMGVVSGGSRTQHVTTIHSDERT